MRPGRGSLFKPTNHSAHANAPFAPTQNIALCKATPSPPRRRLAAPRPARLNWRSRLHMNAMGPAPGPGSAPAARPRRPPRCDAMRCDAMRRAERCCAAEGAARSQVGPGRGRRGAESAGGRGDAERGGGGRCAERGTAPPRPGRTQRVEGSREGLEGPSRTAPRAEGCGEPRPGRAPQV